MNINYRITNFLFICKFCLKNFYRKYIPAFLRKRIRLLLNPDDKFKILRGSDNYRAEKYFLACKKDSIKKNDKYKSYYLQKEFKKYFVRSDLIDDKWWSEFILLTTLKKGHKFEKVNQSLIFKLKNYKFNSLKHFELLDIYHLALRFCLYELAYHLRIKSLNIAIRYPDFLNKSESWMFKAKLSALIETGNYEEFDKLFPMFNYGLQNEKDSLSYLREVLGDSDTGFSTKFNFNIKSKQNKNFQKFIKNKEIVFVGPPPVSSKDGSMIDNSDLIVRANYRSKDSLGDPVYKGSKCDISYINLEQTNHILSNKFSEWPSDITWVVGKVSGNAENIIKKLKLNKIDIKNLNARSIQRLDEGLFNGTLNLLPIIVLDLKGFNPKSIFVYHVDICLTKEKLDGYFPKNWKRNSNDQIHLHTIKTFIGHDPIVQFTILKTFWKKGFIKGDQRFEEVINMSTEKYMKSLQEIYHL